MAHKPLSKKAHVEPEVPKPVVETKKEHTHIMSDSILEYSADINDAEPPPPLPAKTYAGRIESAVKKTSPTTGGSYVAVGVRIPPDEYPPDYTAGDENGELLTYNRLSYDDSPKGRYRMRKFQETIGVRANGATVDLSDWIGRGVGVVVEHNLWEGETRAQIAKLVAA